MEPVGVGNPKSQTPRLSHQIQLTQPLLKNRKLKFQITSYDQQLSTKLYRGNNIRKTKRTPRLGMYILTSIPVKQYRLLIVIGPLYYRAMIDSMYSSPIVFEIQISSDIDKYT